MRFIAWALHQTYTGKIREGFGQQIGTYILTYTSLHTYLHVRPRTWPSNIQMSHPQILLQRGEDEEPEAATSVTWQRDDQTLLVNVESMVEKLVNMVNKLIGWEAG